MLVEGSFFFLDKENSDFPVWWSNLFWSTWSVIVEEEEDSVSSNQLERRRLIVDLEESGLVNVVGYQPVLVGE